MYVKKGKTMDFSDIRVVFEIKVEQELVFIKHYAPQQLALNSK